jgi:endonuclease YncB( thermonuclease family)
LQHDTGLRYVISMPVFTIMTCISLTAVDGDTVKCDGVNLRPMGDGAPYVSGFDTPEIRSHAKCARENHLGTLATDRMAALLQTDGLVIEDSGVRDQYGRPLVTLRLPDGSTIGQQMIDDGFARVWTPGYNGKWCD